MWILASILFLAASVPSVLLQTPADDIPVPHLKLLKSFDTGFTMVWDPINITNVKEPIIGIKLKTWKTPCVIKSYFNLSTTGASWVVASKPETYNSTTIPDILPEYVIIVKPDEVSATVPLVERETWYHIRALAFTATAEGKYSDSYDFKMGSKDENDKKKSCERVISETPCNTTYISPYWKKC